VAKSSATRRDVSRLEVDGEGFVGDVVFGQHRRERTEGRRLDDVDADGEKVGMHLRDGVRPCEHEILVAAFEARTTEVVGTEVEILDIRAKGTVENDDTLGDDVKIRASSHDLTSLSASVS
jgi:hypothetical protein